MNLLFGIFVIAHGLMHASFLSPAPPRTADGPEWPFAMDRSWVVTLLLHLDPGPVRMAGTALVAVTVAAFMVAGMAWVGLAVPASLWQPAIFLGVVASTATLLLFFHPWLVLGFAIDAVLLWLVLIVGWTPTSSVP